MRVTRLFTNSDQQSDLEEIEIELVRSGVEQFLELMAPSAMLLNETDSGHEYDWHNAPQRQWVITLSGEIEIKLRNGQTKRLGPGSILLAEDLTGSGHATKVLSTEPWRCAYLPFDGQPR